MTSQWQLYWSRSDNFIKMIIIIVKDPCSEAAELDKVNCSTFEPKKEALDH